MKHQLNHPRKAHGFTLLEMMVVLVIIGIAATLTSGYLKGSTDGAKATALLQATDDISKAIGLLSSVCGTSTSIAGNVVPVSGSTLLDVVVRGEEEVNPTYAACWREAGLKPMGRTAQVSGTGYKVQGFDVSLTGGGTEPLSFAFTGVKDEIVLKVAKQFDADLEALAASDTSSRRVQYGTATGGMRSLTIKVSP